MYLLVFLCVSFWEPGQTYSNALSFYAKKLLALLLTSSCLQLLSHYICGYPSYLEAMSSIYNLRIHLLWWKEAYGPLGIPRHGWKENNEMDLKKIKWGDVDWIDLAEDRDK